MTRVQPADLIITGDRARLKRLIGKSLGLSDTQLKRDMDFAKYAEPSKSAGYASKTEAAYAQYLDALVHGGEISNWWYAPVSFRLPGKRNRYTPDFLTLCGRGLTFIEVKGWSPSYDRSIVKLKTAAGLTPWADFQLVKRIKGNWEHHVIS